MIAKQGWRILSCSNSLMSKIVKGKYFPNSSFLSITVGSALSFGRDFSKLGLCWWVGNSVEIKVFHDTWIPRPFTFRPVMPKTDVTKEYRVFYLLDESGGGWKHELVNTTFLPLDCDFIFKIPLNFHHPTDQFV
ncbi:hypothetical protein PanWU01x14_330230 [Parasponia andersonii]|uniref:Uncharacterized protein n=1 Tax=Parasponia andersonii TaxID=3476 RepID=A0A2P5AI54_PARAD|nr:hypothetical protein PanWU01x14_330230 [Parasponia andersonii]